MGQAQYEFGKTPDIHVEGHQLVDAQGHPVRFFGFMDTPSAWFNGGRWGWSYDANGVTKCKQYFEKLFTATTDTLHGAYCNLFRLHLEPAWVDSGSNTCWFCGKTTPMGTAKGAKCKYCEKPTFYQTGGKTYDPDDQEVSGEADIHKRSLTSLKTHLGDVYVPIAESANKHGMYVIMRPPGVCPGKIKVGSYYQQFLIKVWDQVTKNAKVKKYSGWLSIELANEPVSVVDANGQDSKTAMRDFFQPVVDKIRENGFEGIIWVPGKGWQASYENYKDYPVEDANMGYAVHNYTGWYGGDDKAYTNGRTVAQYTNQFHNQVPVVDTNPIVITEVDWSPEKKSAAGTGHQNEHGDWVDGNYGTWATGSTSKWGVLYKGLLDKYDNISMTLSSTGCYIDIDASIKSPITPVPAFKTAMERDGLDPWDGSGVACFQWYKDFYYDQFYGYDNDNITIKEVLTKSIKDVTTSPGRGSYVTFEAKFVSGRQGNVAQSCTYEVSDPTIAKVFHGKVIGLAPGETDIVATYTDITGTPYSIPFHTIVTLFPITKDGFNPAVQGGGSITSAGATILSYSAVKNGIAGWNYGSSPVDISQFDSISVVLAAKPTSASKAALRIYDTADLSGAYAEIPLAQVSEAHALLKGLLKTDGKELNLKQIYTVGIYTAASATIRLREVYLSNSKEEDAIETVRQKDNAKSQMYDLNGVQLNRKQKGVTILRKDNGKTQKVLVK